MRTVSFTWELSDQNRPPVDGDAEMPIRLLEVQLNLGHSQFNAGH
jgi:hypothetical protein